MKTPAGPVPSTPNLQGALKRDGFLSKPTFIISRISTLNVLLKRRAAIYAKRAFNLSPVEWRIVTLLLTYEPISIIELAKHALADPAHISRGAAKLAKKGYVVREQSPHDQREALLKLTKLGKTVSIAMNEASFTRNDELIQGREADEVQAIITTLDEFIARARTLVERDELEEKAIKVAKRTQGNKER
jgi:DNA-binding MarR family transcriptional regulator